MRLAADADRPVTLVAQITVRVMSDGSMGVEGPTHDLPWMLAALAHAAQAVRDQHSTRPIVVPGHDTSLVLPASEVVHTPNYRRSA
jgi:hypothetical protein